jgi:eukaryotic-like serine/threonine-protein kinase
VLFQLAEFGEVVKEVAASPEALERLDGPKCGEVWPELAELGKSEGFVSLGLWDTEGGRVARWPHLGEAMHCDRRFGWTNYFRGAEHRARGGRREAYVARTSTSEVTGQDKFTLSAPIFDAAGVWRGVFYVSVGADSVLKRVALYPDDDPRHTAALLGRRDITRETKNDPLPENFVVVIHQALAPGHTYAVDSVGKGLLTSPSLDVDQWELNPQPPVIIEDYVDPVPGFEGRWLAAVAPVGFTNFAVVVQTRVEAILEPDARLVRGMLLWAGLPFAVLALALNLGFWAVRRRRE